MKRIIQSVLIVIFAFTGGILNAQVQNALSFDNLDDYVDVPNASSLIVNSSTISMTCWVFPMNTNITWPDYDGFCGFRNNTNADFYLIQHAPVGVEARFRNASGTNTDIVFSNLQINTWTHFAFTYDGSMTRLYVNGVLFNAAPASGTITSGVEPFYIGNMWYSTVQFYMNGNLDEVSLWNKALSQEEVNHIYNCSINPASSNLVLYYKFDQGIAGGNNTSITSLIPTTGTLNGVLHNFALTGNTSNFIAGVPSTFYQISETICNGESYQFGSQVLTTPGIYTETFPTASGCDSVVQLTLMVYTVNTSVTLAGVTLTAQQAGATYKWLNCNTGFTPIPGATGQSYTATANGSYAVAVTINNCTDTSNCVPVTTVGINDQNGIPNLLCYPNPVEDLIFIDLGQIYEKVSLEFYNIQGQKMFTAHYAAIQQVRQDVADLPSGVYFMRITADNRESFSRIIK